ncbi:MAG: hypothetical protein HKL86_00630 [Acidimicrobiaceae bacterium]|nr:hypothetical protein [Acidimicrobiaceae bacterium]
MMRRLLASVTVGALALGSVIVVGAGAASAATTTPTVTLSGGKGMVPGSTPDSPATIIATTSVAGAVTFNDAGTTIAGCSSVATTTVAPFVATCSWVPTVAGPTALGATFVPTDTVDYVNATAPTYNVVIAAPIQGNTGPITFTVDTVGTSNSCGIQSSFVVGDGIVFRVAANDADLGGAPLTSANVSSATLTVNGYSTTIPLTYGNHGGLGMWTGVLQTGTATGDYSPTGAIPYTITMQTIAVPAVTKKVSVVSHKRLKVKGKMVTRWFRTTKTVVVTPAVPGATGTFTPSHTMSVLTLLAAPVTLK